MEKQSVKIKRSTGEKIFDFCNVVFMLFMIVITLYPFLYVVFGSVSMPAEFSRHTGLLLAPTGFQLEAYRLVLQNEDILTGYLNTLIYVGAGTSISILLTILMAFVVSRKKLMLKSFLIKMMMLTMFFSGGMIPTYLMMQDIGIMGTRFSVILPGLISVTNVIILRTAFMGIPQGLEESAKIDGANDFIVLFKVIVPLSMPAIAVMVLFYGVGRWNSWFDAFLYLRNRELFPLQLILREILVESSTDNMMISLGALNGLDMSEIIKYATIIVSTIPILCIYPLLQKHFVKGVMIGAIKG